MDIIGDKSLFAIEYQLLRVTSMGPEGTANLWIAGKRITPLYKDDLFCYTADALTWTVRNLDRIDFKEFYGLKPNAILNQLLHAADKPYWGAQLTGPPFDHRIIAAVYQRSEHKILFLWTTTCRKGKLGDKKVALWGTVAVEYVARVVMEFDRLNQFDRSTKQWVVTANLLPPPLG